MFPSQVWWKAPFFHHTGHVDRCPCQNVWGVSAFPSQVWRKARVLRHASSCATAWSLGRPPHTTLLSETDKQTKNHKDVLQHGPWDIHPIKRYSLKQTHKQRTRETCYRMGTGTSAPHKVILWTDKQTKNHKDVLQHGPWDIHPIIRYSLKQTSKQRTIKTCYSTVLGTFAPHKVILWNTQANKELGRCVTA